MEPTTEEQKLWKALAQAAEDSGPDPAPPALAGVSQNPTFLDRSAERFSSGTLVLFAISAVTMTLIGIAGQASNLIVAPLLSLVACWLLAPLVRRRSGLSPWALIALTIPVALSAALAIATPLAVNGESSGYRFFSHYLQYGLETVLVPSNLVLLFALCLLLAAASRWLQRVCPWTDTLPAPTWRSRLAQFALIAPLLLAFGLARASRPSPEAYAWLQTAPMLIESRSERTAAPRERSADWSEIKTQSFFAESESDQAERLAQYERVAKLALDAVPLGVPSRTNARHLIFPIVDDLLKNEKLSLAATDRVKLILLALEARLTDRPSYQYLSCEDMIETQLIPILLSTDVSPAELTAIAERIEKIHALLPSQGSEELEKNAAGYFFPEKPQEPMVFAKLTGDNPNRRRAPGPDDLGKGRNTSTPLEAFGTTFNNSPTQIAQRWSDSREVEAWLRLRKRLSALTFEAQLALLRELIDQHEPGKSPWTLQFLESLDGRRYVDTVGPWLETAKLILRLRKAKLTPEGDYPTALPAQVTDRWNWQHTDQGWRLTDSKLRSSTDRRQHPSWIMP